VGDIFYKWDGFIYYNASFSKFLPTVALVTIYWTIVAAFITTLVWLSGRILERFFMFIGWKVRMEHWLLFVSVFTLFGAAVWILKQEFIPYGTTVEQKLIVFSCVSLLALFLTWICRNRVEKWIGFLQEKITPMVWLFGILVVLSILLVVYHTL
jgi:hypothetical protein